MTWFIYFLWSLLLVWCYLKDIYVKFKYFYDRIVLEKILTVEAIAPFLVMEWSWAGHMTILLVKYTMQMYLTINEECEWLFRVTISLVKHIMQIYSTIHEKCE